MSTGAVAERFATLRPYLMRMAYSQLGSLADAEDVVQEAWLRLERADVESILDLRAWLTRVVGRIALDALGSARARRETYVGQWLPEPLLSDPATGSDPADRVTLDETVSFALLAVLERLSPAERTAFLLHDVFGMSFESVAEVVGRTPAAARQLAVRARRDVAEARPRFETTPSQQRATIDAFATAASEGDLEALLAVLDPTVIFRSDGGGVVPAARRPLVGAERVGRAILAFVRANPGGTVRPIAVNGLPGLLLESDGVHSVYVFSTANRRITAIDVVRNPQKLSRVAEYGVQAAAAIERGPR